MSNTFLLAIDGGGTKTQVICADENQQIIGEGVSGPTSLTATTAGAAGFNLREAIRQSIVSLPPDSTIGLACMGLAGMDTTQESSTARQVFTQVLDDLKIGRFELVNDIVIALENGTTEKNALALISGTGSNCYGRNAAGETAHSSGMDYLLTDQGSGYGIGRAALRAAVKSFDGRGAKTQLEQFVSEHFRISTIAELKDKVHNPMINKTEVAEIAQVCLRAMDQGDVVAKEIFTHATDELVLMAKAVLTRLRLLDQPVDCVLSGSVTKISSIQEPLQVKLKELCPQIKVLVPDQAPVYGALRLAARLYHP
jgi:N-acetylglucosamine kinase-like BadF-type ATPase